MEAKCLGFGEFTGKCENVPGKNLYWCDRCNSLRIAYLDERFSKFMSELKESWDDIYGPNSR
jgi:hypothetical protein